MGKYLAVWKKKWLNLNHIHIIYDTLMILTNKHPEVFLGVFFKFHTNPTLMTNYPGNSGVATWPLPLLRAWPLISSPPGGIRSENRRAKPVDVGRLAGYPIVDRVFYILSVAGLGISEPSTVMLSFLSYAFDVWFLQIVSSKFEEAVECRMLCIGSRTAYKLPVGRKFQGTHCLCVQERIWS